MAGAKKICQQLGMEHLLLQNGKRWWPDYNSHSDESARLKLWIV
jgi:hypothetical protein